MTFAHTGAQRVFVVDHASEDFTQKPVTIAHSLDVGHGHGELQLREAAFRRIETIFGAAFEVCGLCTGIEASRDVRSWWHPAEANGKEVLLLLAADLKAAILVSEECLSTMELPLGFVRVMRWKGGSKLFRAGENSVKASRASKAWVLVASASLVALSKSTVKLHLCS